MPLFATTLITALVLLATGGVLLWNGKPVGAIARHLPRSRRAAWVTMGIGAVWTLYHVTQLTEADFGNYKGILFVAFAALAILSVRFVPDFLAVRGACVIALLVAHVLLTSSFMKFDEPGHQLLNVFAYILIFLALYLAVSPFRVRDFFQWLFGRPQRPRILGAVAAAYGLALLVAALQQ